MNDSALHLLGLARKGGRIEVGEEPAGGACRARKKEYLKPCAYNPSEALVGLMACLLKNEPASQRHVARLTRVWGSRSESEY